MAISTNATSLRLALDRANPVDLADMLRSLGLGGLVRSMTATLRRKSPHTAAANGYVLATLEALTLPDDAKASAILRATARAGGGTLGELAPQAYGATPADAQIAVAPNGDIVTLAASAYTDVDVEYVPEKADAFELTLSVAANVLTIPVSLTAAGKPGVALLMEAEALVGTATGKKIVLVPGAGAPAAGQARLNLAKSTVTFAVADAVTSARVKLALSSAIDVDALLEAASSFI